MNLHEHTPRTTRRPLALRLAAAATAIAAFAALLLTSKRLGEDVDFLGLSDKTIHLCGHIGVYGLLAMLIYKALGDRWALAWVVTNVLAAGEEWRQQFVPGRRASVNDEMVNLLTITAGIGVAMLVTWWRSRRSSRLAEAATTGTRH